MYRIQNYAPVPQNGPSSDWSQEVRRLETAGQNVIPFTEGPVMQRPEAGASADGTMMSLNAERTAQNDLRMQNDIQTQNRLQMQNGLPTDVIENPVSREEVYKGSLKAMLSQNVGNYIVATFLVGTQSMVAWEGILYDVGNDYLTIYQQPRDRYIVSDIYSLKFIEFYDTERRDACEEILRQTGWRREN